MAPLLSALDTSRNNSDDHGRRVEYFWMDVIVKDLSSILTLIGIFSFRLCDVGMSGLLSVKGLSVCLTSLPPPPHTTHNATRKKDDEKGRAANTLLEQIVHRHVSG